jgi:hypothetical protein
MRRLAGNPWPGQLVGPVGVNVDRQLGVEQQLTSRTELGEVRERTPTDEEIAVRVVYRAGLNRMPPARHTTTSPEARPTSANLPLWSAGLGMAASSMVVRIWLICA